ncbi:arrestin domain-containing protein 3-like [Daphnia pulicaria]|uniref:arrestin domain-containing protein 3-like n=1 Tax=Daphnia pulicaria TaxID=35523 RepID=UPI001EEB3AC6|nr:arrestin domain-containing protein 3-like [Daphnia pulicaria]
MDNFSVELDQAKGVFLPGQNVSGLVQFQLTAPESFKGLTVECIGKSQVHWSETETSGRETETVHYQASENYFYHKIQLFAGSDKELEPDYYRYAFSFTLPHQLPASFEGAHGSLRYYIKAVLGRRWMLDAVFKRGISVNTIVDLNQNFQASIPVKNEETKTVCCLCCQSGPITAIAWLPKSGYVPGETILFCGRVDNKSRSRLLHTSVRLVERTIFKAQGKQKEDERVIREITRNQQTAPERENLELWNDIPIIVPPLAPSDLHHCSIIDLRYFIEFIVNPGTLSFNFKVPIEITIGTIPFRDSFPTFQPQASAPPFTNGINVENNVTHPIGFLPPFMINQYPNLPQSTYESGVFSGNLREEGDTEHLNIGFDTLFKPTYISYPSVDSQNNPSS